MRRNIKARNPVIRRRFILLPRLSNRVISLQRINRRPINKGTTRRRRPRRLILMTNTLMSMASPMRFMAGNKRLLFSTAGSVGDFMTRIGTGTPPPTAGATTLIIAIPVGVATTRPRRANLAADRASLPV
jgi:hypothetical protein